jgi:hypothetical protein
MVIKAVYRDGKIHPLDPVPADWTDGQRLQIQPAATARELSEQFGRLAAAWIEDTRYLSSTADMATHPAYQRIIGMGRDALPLILAELRKEPRQWFWALMAIAGEDPVAERHKGKVREMADAWIQWGKQKGLIQDDAAGA